MSVAAAVAGVRRRQAPAQRGNRAAVSTADFAVAGSSRAPPQEQAASLEALGGHWWAALDAAETALREARRVLPAQELRERGGRLRREREDTIGYLDSLARAERVALSFSYLLVSRSNLRRLLGLPSSVTACVFNLDGVLIGSAAMHVAAWTETFDDFIAARVERTHGRFAPFNSLSPFNPSADYAKHIHGKTRLEGVRAFLATRGISLPEGDPRDPPGTETVHGLANRKKEALLRRLDEQGVAAIRGSKRYLETARDAGIHCAAISASANTDTILEQAGLTGLIEHRVDGNAILAERLRPRPAPDIALAACRELGVSPEHAAVFETSPAGVAAARAGGFDLVIGVDPTGNGGALGAQGADRVIAGLADLLEQDLAA